MTEILKNKTTRNEESLKCRSKVGRCKSTQLYVEKAIIELQKERNKLVCWLIHAGHFFCLILTVSVNVCQHLSQVLPFCLNITNTWACRPYKQHGDQNCSGFKAGSCLALPLLLLAPYGLCVRWVPVSGGRTPTVHHQQHFS